MQIGASSRNWVAMRKKDNPEVRGTEKRISILVRSSAKLHVPESQTSATQCGKRHTAFLAISSKCYTRAMISAVHQKTLIDNLLLE